MLAWRENISDTYGFIGGQPRLQWRALLRRDAGPAVTVLDPTTYVNHKVEEMCKAAQGIHTPLGKAVLAFHRRWG